MASYSATVMEHFTHPRNAGEIEGADRVGRAGDPDDGPATTLYITLDGDRVVLARYQTYGCGAAIAAGSMLTELMMGRTVTQCLEISPEQLCAALDGLPAHKLHCAELAVGAMRAALASPG